MFIHTNVSALKCLPSFDGKLERFVSKKWKKLLRIIVTNHSVDVFTREIISGFFLLKHRNLGFYRGVSDKVIFQG